MKLFELFAFVDEKIKEDKAIKSTNKDKIATFKKLHEIEMRQRELSTKGLPEARDLMIEKIFICLKSISEITPFNIDSLIEQYHINYYKNIYTGDIIEFGENTIDLEIEDYCNRFRITTDNTYEEKLEKLSQIVYQETYGYSVIDELLFSIGDETLINEIGCNRYDYIWIQFKGVKRQIPNFDFKFLNEEVYNKIIENRITSDSSSEMNQEEPIINCSLKNGYRVTALRPYLSKYFTVNIRYIYSKNMNFKFNNIMQDKMHDIIKIAVKRGRRNVCIMGEQGSGKTTAANEIIIKNLDDNLAIGLAENVHELNISEKYPKKNVIELRYSKKYAPSEITETFFRLNRDIIIFGEIRSKDEALEMIKAMLRQARGSMFTFHSSSTQRLIHDLRLLLMQTGYYSDYRECQYDIADAIDIIIQIKAERDSGKRYVYKISEVIAYNNFEFETRDIFKYDKEKRIILLNKKGFSDQFYESCKDFEMTTDDVEKIKSLLVIKKNEENIFSYF